MHNYFCDHRVDKRQERSTAEPRFIDQVRARPSGEKCGLRPGYSGQYLVRIRQCRSLGAGCTKCPLAFNARLYVCRSERFSTRSITRGKPAFRGTGHCNNKAIIEDTINRAARSAHNHAAGARCRSGLVGRYGCLTTARASAPSSRLCAKPQISV